MPAVREQTDKAARKILIRTEDAVTEAMKVQERR